MHTTPLIALAACSSVALAQAEEGVPLEVDTSWSTTLRLDASHNLAFDTDIDSSDASVTTNVTRFGVGLNFARPDNRLAFGVAFRGEVTDYDFDNADTLVAGLESAPFDTLLGLSYALLAMAFFSREGRLTQVLAKAGRISLTNYIATSFVFALLFASWGLGLFGLVTRAQAFALSFVPIALMAIGSPLCLRVMRQGPLERLWRSAARQLS